MFQSRRTSSYSRDDSPKANSGGANIAGSGSIATRRLLSLRPSGSRPGRKIQTDTLHSKAGIPFFLPLRRIGDQGQLTGQLLPEFAGKAAEEDLCASDVGDGAGDVFASRR